jgi:hypothetical protein
LYGGDDVLNCSLQLEIVLAESQTSSTQRVWLVEWDSADRELI